VCGRNVPVAARTLDRAPQSAAAAPRLYLGNRLHLDRRADDQDFDDQRITDLGASRVDIGQGDQSWVVLADPEGFATQRTDQVYAVHSDGSVTS